MKRKDELDDSPLTISILKVARKCDVSRWTVQNWVAQGMLPYIAYPGRKGGDLRGAKIRVKDLERFIDQHQMRKK